MIIKAALLHYFNSGPSIVCIQQCEFHRRGLDWDTYDVQKRQAGGRSQSRPLWTGLQICISHDRYEEHIEQFGCHILSMFLCYHSLLITFLWTLFFILSFAELRRCIFHFLVVRLHIVMTLPRI